MAAPRGCMGNLQVGSFRLTVRPGPALPVRSLNTVRAGQILRYEPVQLLTKEPRWP